MPKLTALGAFHHHEVLHAVAMVQSLFDQWIEGHAYTQATPDVREAAEKAAASLSALYQLVGSKEVPNG